MKALTMTKKKKKKKGKWHPYLQESQRVEEHKKKYGAGTCKRYIKKVTRNNLCWSNYA